MDFIRMFIRPFVKALVKRIAKQGLTNLQDTRNVDVYALDGYVVFNVCGNYYKIVFNYFEARLIRKTLLTWKEGVLHGKLDDVE